MEDQFGLYGVEGNGDLTLFRNEVNMTLPYSEGDTFTITNASPIVPLELKDQFEGTGYIIRDFDDPNDTDDITEDKEPGVTSLVYGSAKSMQNVTMETDLTYPGEDLLLGNDDDGRSIMLAYENIPFKMVQGGSTFVLGDNYSFDAVLENSWNLASSLIVDNDLTAESLVASLDFDQGANDIALKIAELGNGEFSKDISDINADLGNSLADLNDNIDHQKTIEDLLLEQRNAVSSVSIDEEVADLMQFQRSFQASSRVLNTLDKMLELVVMGLIK
jgi:flagellar hook-associated protein FlgK